jgi:hypothetical protein
MCVVSNCAFCISETALQYIWGASFVLTCKKFNEDGSVRTSLERVSNRKPTVWFGSACPILGVPSTARNGSAPSLCPHFSDSPALQHENDQGRPSQIHFSPCETVINAINGRYTLVDCLPLKFTRDILLLVLLVLSGVSIVS